MVMGTVRLEKIRAGRYKVVGLEHINCGGEVWIDWEGRGEFRWES